DAVAAAVPGESALEPGVTPDLGESFRLRTGPVHARAATRVVRDVGGHDHDGDEQAERVDHPEGLAARDLLAGIEAPGRRGDRGRASDAAGVDDPRGWFGVAAFAFADQGAEPVHDRLP